MILSIIIILRTKPYIFGIAASTLFGKGLTVKNVTPTWYRLSNITVYSFHTLLTFFLIRESWLSPSYIHPVQEF